MSLPVSPSGDPAVELGRDLREVIGRLVRAVNRAQGLPPIAFEVLGLLDRTGPMTASDLAVQRRVRPQTMAATVKEAMAAGYVVGHPHPVDGRKIVLQLTTAGTAALQAERESRVALITDLVLSVLTAPERTQLGAVVPLLQRLAGAAEDGDRRSLDE